MREERPWLSQLWRGSEGWMCPPVAGEPPAHSVLTLPSPSGHSGILQVNVLELFSLSSRGNGIQLLWDELCLTPQPGGAGCHKTSWGHFLGITSSAGLSLPYPRLAQGLGQALQQEQEFQEAAPHSACKAGKLSQPDPSSRGLGLSQHRDQPGPPVPKSALQPSPGREKLLICV